MLVPRVKARIKVILGLVHFHHLNLIVIIQLWFVAPAASPAVFTSHCIEAVYALLLISFLIETVFV